MKEIKLTITALVTEEGFEDRIENILEDDVAYTEFGNQLLFENAHKVAYALDNKWVEIIGADIEVKNHTIGVSK